MIWDDPDFGRNDVGMEFDAVKCIEYAKTVNLDLKVPQVSAVFSKGLKLWFS